jgi:ribosomal protein S27E
VEPSGSHKEKEERAAQDAANSRKPIMGKEGKMAGETEVTEELLVIARKLAEKQKAKTEQTRANIGKYPHAQPDTLQFDAEARKYSVEIRCAECGATRRVFTSDLFQIHTCIACSDKVKATKAAEKKAQLEAALKLVKEGKV